MRKNETRKETFKACECDHVAHGEAPLSRVREGQKQDNKGRTYTIEPSFFQRSEGGMKRGVRVYERDEGRKGERQRLPQLAQSAGSR